VSAILCRCCGGPLGEQKILCVECTLNDRGDSSLYIMTELRDIAQRALDREKICLDALTKIACWNQGKVVTSSFDEPASARIARECLNYLDTTNAGQG
jgi:hypothetical protein